MKDLLDLDTGTVLRVYKPLTWTSFDVTKKIQRLVLRKMARIRVRTQEPKRKVKVGHAGTLDPLADGLLIVCIGKETKNIEKYMGLPKTYTGTFCLGAFRPSYDKETEITETWDTSGITPEMIEAAARSLTGELSQVPPLFSAIKKDGVRAYDRARAGSDMELDARKVMVHSFKITSINMPFVGFEIVCSKGTYIRSLARDFGRAMQNGAYLETLRRTCIGEFNLEQAITLDELAEIFGETPSLKNN